ncbi:DUF3043 domain-containing protein [Nocardioides sp. 31GB23]|uniref:DUF3043 domain-containing protein n=1 Tax=Nocardioides sp. 31GB23 TaxID=3156065 RepID=UPI0032AEAC82
MFRRSKSEPVPDTTSSAVPGAGPTTERPSTKGRPTPTRKEAEAMARARAKPPRTRREMAQAQRSARGESTARVKAGMKAGEERYLMARDKGPVRRFTRDFVDARFSFVELMIPILLVTMVLSYSGNAGLASFGSSVLLLAMLLVVMDMVLLRFRLRRELVARFPDDSHKGTTYYAITRAMQMRFMRLPKTQVKMGQSLPEHYR